MSILNTSASNLIKTCCRCHQHLPATSEYFNKNKTHCRNCARAYRAAWYLAHSDKVKARQGPNRFEHRPDRTTVLFLERRDGSQLECILWTKDYPKVQPYRWSASWSSTARTFYAQISTRGDKQRAIRMHRLILPDCEEVDHKNGNGLDNRVYDPLFDVGNIRPATHIENMYNRGKQRGAYSSLFKGVSWDKKAHQWRARIRFKGKQVYLGGFNTELEASFAYQEAATKYHREFACVEGHQ